MTQRTDRASIKRATLAAQRAVEALDADKSAELLKLFEQAKVAIEARIAAHAGADGNVGLQELPLYSNTMYSTN